MNGDFVSFLFFSLSILSLWFRRDPRIWGSFLILSMGAARLNGLIETSGLGLVFTLGTLWALYAAQETKILRNFAAVSIFVLSSLLLFQSFSQFSTYYITQNFFIRFDNTLIGFFPLIFLVKLVPFQKSWKDIFLWTLVGLGGIVALLIAAVFLNLTSWSPGIPTYPWLTYWALLFFFAITQEGFFRGFVQGKITQRLNNTPIGHVLGILIAAVLFTISQPVASELYTLIFLFLANILYGLIYAFSKRIESAILTHFLFLFFYMNFFTF
jgi:uncharacterized protein